MQYQIDLRQTISSAQADVLLPAVSITDLTLPYTVARIGVQAGATPWHVHSFQYAGEIERPLFSFLSLQGRLDHGFFVRDRTSLTHLALFSHLHTNQTQFLGGFASLGWYQRWSRIEGLLIPTFSSSFREHDFLASLGLWLQVTQTWSFVLSAATYETFEIYNLNNPFGELRVRYSLTSAWTLSTYFRYKIALGFGRWEEISLGINLVISPHKEQ